MSLIVIILSIDGIKFLEKGEKLSSFRFIAMLMYEFWVV